MEFFWRQKHLQLIHNVSVVVLVLKIVYLLLIAEINRDLIMLDRIINEKIVHILIIYYKLIVWSVHSRLEDLRHWVFVFLMDDGYVWKVDHGLIFWVTLYACHAQRLWLQILRDILLLHHFFLQLSFLQRLLSDCLKSGHAIPLGICAPPSLTSFYIISITLLITSFALLPLAVISLYHTFLIERDAFGFIFSLVSTFFGRAIPENVLRWLNFGLLLRRRCHGLSHLVVILRFEEKIFGFVRIKFMLIY